MTVRIAFSNNKGGCGKTMCLFQTSGLLSTWNYKVLCVDFDPQGNLTSAFTSKEIDVGANELLLGQVSPLEKGLIIKPYPNDVLLKNIYLLPTTRELNFLDRSRDKNQRIDIKNILGKIDKDFDLVLIDTSPSVNLVNALAYYYVDYIIGVLDNSNDSKDGFDYVYKTLITETQKLNPKLDILGIVANNNKKSNFSKTLNDVFKIRYGKYMFDTVIDNGIKAVESRAIKLPLIEYAPSEKLTNQFAHLSAEIVKRLKLEVKING